MTAQSPTLGILVAALAAAHSALPGLGRSRSQPALPMRCRDSRKIGTSRSKSIRPRWRSVTRTKWRPSRVTCTWFKAIPRCGAGPWWFSTKTMPRRSPKRNRRWRKQRRSKTSRSSGSRPRATLSSSKRTRPRPAKTASSIWSQYRTLLGNVVISQGQNVVKGDRLTVDMTTGVSRVECGKPPCRVQALLNPSTMKP